MSPEVDYLAAHSGAAAVELASLGWLVFGGPDRQRFLHGQLSADVQGLETGRSTHACVLTPKGKLVADFFLYNRGEDLVALCRGRAVAHIQGALAKAMPLSKTIIQEAATGSAFYLQGSGARALLQKFLGPRGAEFAACARSSWQADALGVYSYPLWDASGLVLIPSADAALGFWRALQEAGRPQGLRVLTPATLEVLRVEAGVAEPGVDYDADVYPLEVGLEGAINFTKGCFMGQETIAHIKNRGHLNRRLAGLRLDAQPAVGAEVVAEGKPIGRVTSAVLSPRLGAWLGLAFLRAPYDALGVQVAVGSTRAEVVALPIGRRS